jgi:hypothetical protein
MNNPIRWKRVLLISLIAGLGCVALILVLSLAGLLVFGPAPP